MTNKYMNDEAELPNIGYKQNKNNCLAYNLLFIIILLVFTTCHHVAQTMGLILFSAFSLEVHHLLLFREVSLFQS